MAKIIYVGLPAHGHTNPTLPVMQELIQRGHQILYYNAETFRTKVEPTGVDFRALPEPMPTELEISQALSELIKASLIISQMSRHLIPFIIAELQREKADLVIYDSVAMWGYVAARTHNIPHICSITHFVLDGLVSYMGMGTILRYIWSALPHARKLLRWKRDMALEFGKENAGGITEYGNLNLVYTSKAFHPANKVTDERFRFVGPSINAATRLETDFPYEQLSNGRKVYISLGTINHLDHDFYHAAFEAFGDYPAHFILSVGKHTDILQLGVIPANFIVQNTVPQLNILQRVDAFITHGGMNSVHEGLYYGVPEVVVPHQLEQYLNGKRVVETGSGVMIGDKHPYGRVTADELHNALDTILNNPSYQKQAQYYGQTLREAGGYLAAVAEIEAFIGAKQPQFA
jgi:MGT family glycosyltransferase